MSTVADTLTAPGPSAQARGMLDPENPWPGLESFREEDSGFFRGRDAASETLLRHVNRERLTVLYGFSGLGKSSLLRAGLFPALRDDLVLPVYIRLDYNQAAPPLRRQVLDRLATEADRQDLEAPPTRPTLTLWEHFHRQESAYWTVDHRPVTPMLVFDQFEEAFTIGRTTAEQARRTAEFLDELADLIEGRPSAELKTQLDAGESDPRAFVFNLHPYKVLLSIREDFLGQLETLKDRIPSLQSNRMRLSPLSGTAALLVTQAGGERLVPREVGEQIVRFVADERAQGAPAPLLDLVVDPAILSLFCDELNKRRRRLRRSSIAADLLEGSKEAIIAEFYERSFTRLDPAVRRFVEDDLLTGSGEYRRSSALEDALSRAGVTEDAIRGLVRGRLLRMEERSGTQHIELTHDVLVGVVRASRDRRREQEKQVEQRQREDQARRAARRKARARLAWALALLVAGGLAWAFAVIQTDKALVARAEAAIASAEAQQAHEHAAVLSLRARADSVRADSLLRAAWVEREISDQFKRLNAEQSQAMEASRASLVDLLNRANPIRRPRNLSQVGLDEEAVKRLPLLAADEAVSGRLGEAEGYHSAWRFAGVAEQPAAFSLVSGEFDAYLYLFDADTGNLIAEDDDGGDGVNSLIRLTLPSTRDYVVVAGSYEGRTAGSFVLQHADSIQAGDGAEEEEDHWRSVGRPRHLEDLGLAAGLGARGVPELPSNGTVRGLLGEPGFEVDGRLYSVWLFRAERDSQSLFGLGSAEFDAYLYVFDALSGELLQWDDDGGEGTDSLIQAELSGGREYLVAVSSFGPGDSGWYELTHLDATDEMFDERSERP